MEINYGTTMTIGSGITITGGMGEIFSFLSGAGAIINEGTITAAAGDSITINLASFVNQGTVQADP